MRVRHPTCHGKFLPSNIPIFSNVKEQHMNKTNPIFAEMLAQCEARDELRSEPSDFITIEVLGNSMAPLFRHGDQIIIDKRDRNPCQPGPFALWDGDGYVIKLVERSVQRKGWYRIFSENSRYSSYEVDENDIEIIGRPIWFGRRV
jgi:phage repressor protein C with HTH and peptisase S24 domain